VLFASHQLEGSTSEWWDAYVNALPYSSRSPGCDQAEEERISRFEQGSMSVNEYVTHFTQLSRYAMTDVDIDGKKQNCFLNGLNNGLAYALEDRNYENF
jgi:hypothetical protein